MNSGTQHIQTEDLSAYIDGFVDERLRAAIARHLATCGECRAEFAELRATVRLLALLPALSPPKSFQLGPEHATAKPPQSRILTLLPVVRALSVAAAIALLVVSGAFLFDSSDADDLSNTIVFSEATSESSGGSGETDSRSDSSESAEDAGVYSSAAAADGADESQQPQQEGLIDRGNAAAAGDGPMIEAPIDDDSQPPSAAGAESADRAESDTVAQNLPAPSGASIVAATADERQVPWGTIASGMGVATIVLAGLWITLSRVARSTIRGDP
jgi:anti-sigma factor RsiW